jgi:hypothetical protein
MTEKVPYWHPHGHPRQEVITYCSICGERISSVGRLTGSVYTDEQYLWSKFSVLWRALGEVTLAGWK